MPVIDDLAFFQRLARAESMTATARDLGLSLAAVSKRLAQLERRLGVTLMQRSTRKLSLTAEGELYLERGASILAELAELEGALSDPRQSLRGSLRVSATFGFGRRHIAPLLSSFAQRHPELELQLELGNYPPSLDDGFDLVIRVGPPPDARLVARRLLANRRVLCAAPAYLEAHGAPADLDALAAHRCIVLRENSSDHAIWRFIDQDRERAVRIKGTLSTNDGEVAVGLALDGHGLLLRSWWDVQVHLAQGRLVELLPGIITPSADFYAVYRPRRHPSRRLEALLGWLSEALPARVPTSRA